MKNLLCRLFGHRWVPQQILHRDEFVGSYLYVPAYCKRCFMDKPFVKPTCRSQSSPSLKLVPVDRLYVRMDVARGVFEHSAGDQMRRRALAEIKAVRAELSARRQLSVETQW